MNVGAAIYAVADHGTVVVFLVIHRAVHRAVRRAVRRVVRRVVRLVISGIPPLRVHLAGVNVAMITQETVLLRATSVVAVVRRQAPKILLRPVFKRF